MSLEPTKSTRKRQAAEQREDALDITFEYLAERMPDILAYQDEFKRALRQLLGGEHHYIKKRESCDKVSAEDVLRIFNGRNAAEVGRKLGIGRSSVYRHIKQPGRG